MGRDLFVMVRGTAMSASTHTRSDREIVAATRSTLLTVCSPYAILDRRIRGFGREMSLLRY